jgi:hypothetical protein
MLLSMDTKGLCTPGKVPKQAHSKLLFGLYLALSNIISVDVLPLLLGIILLSLKINNGLDRKVMK